jgi:hypothetical protein
VTVDERKRAGLRGNTPRLDDNDNRSGLADQIAHSLRFTECLGGDEHLALRGDGDKARPEDGKSLSGAAPLAGRQRTVCRSGVLSLRTPVGARSELRAAGGPRFAPPLPLPRIESFRKYQAGWRQSRRFRPELSIGGDEMRREQREQGRTRLRFERGQQPYGRLVPVRALRPDIEGSQCRHASFLVFDPNGVLGGCRKDIDPSLSQSKLAGVRHNANATVPHLDQKFREEIRFDRASRA